MLMIPNELVAAYSALLQAKKIQPDRMPEYRKWLRYYLDFCDKYPLPESKSERVRLFCEKLREKKQSDKQREQTAYAVSLYFELLSKGAPANAESGIDQKEPSPDGFMEAITDKSLSRNSVSGQHTVAEDVPQYTNLASRKSQFSEAGYQQKSESPE